MKIRTSSSSQKSNQEKDMHRKEDCWEDDIGKNKHKLKNQWNMQIKFIKKKLIIVIVAMFTIKNHEKI